MPYAEFLKCLHLYEAGIVNYDELLLLLLRSFFCTAVLLKSVGNHLLQKNWLSIIKILFTRKMRRRVLYQND